MQLGQVGLVDTGLNWKLKILSSTFPRKVFQISVWKYLFCAQQEVFRVFIFPYFVLSCYILAQSYLKTFPKWKHFSFSILKWHIIAQTNRNSKLFFKDKHSYEWSSFGVNFFPGAAITCKLYYNLSIKAKNYQFD